MAAEAKARGEQGWTVTLQAPSYGPFMTYSSQRDIKEKLYREYNSRSLGGKYDNTANIKRITELRLKIANLLGYKCYADYVLEDRMAETSKAVNKFLDELLRETKEYAHKGLPHGCRVCTHKGSRRRSDAVGLGLLQPEIQGGEVCHKRRAGKALS